MKYFYIIKAISEGLLTVFKHVLKKPVTGLYPEEKPRLNHRFRGEHALVLNSDNEIICKGCGLCEKVCPSLNTIKISKDNQNKIDEFSIDLSKCIFCGNCVSACPLNALIMTSNFELSVQKKSTLKLDINTLKNNYIKAIMNK